MEKQISGLVLARYMSEPIKCLYTVASTKWIYEALSFFQLVVIGVDMVFQSSI
jgi:hypothetical protein